MTGVAYGSELLSGAGVVGPHEGSSTPSELRL